MPKDKDTDEGRRERFIRSDYIPSREEYQDEVWASYKTFKVNGSEQDGMSSEVFARYEFVYLKQPEDVAPTTKKAKGKAKKKEIDPWIGRITAIKAVAPTNVCIAVQWLYSSQAQLLEAGVSRKDLPVLIGNEVVMGLHEFEHQDLQSHSTVSDHARVLTFDEQNPLQDLIELDGFFYRSKLMFAPTSSEDRKQGKGKRKAGAGSSRLVVEPFKQPSCTCNAPYKPLPLNNANPMVFCPRDNCHRWYHTACLDPPGPATTDSIMTLMTSCYDPTTVPEEERVAAPSKRSSKAIPEATEAPNDIAKLLTPEATPQPVSLSVDAFPYNVIRYAKSNILRGDSDNGIVGNGGVVLGARSIIAAGPDERESLIAAWLAKYGPGEDGENWDGVYADSPSFELQIITPTTEDQVYRCPHCDDVI